MTPADFLALSRPAQRRHLRALALEARRVDVSRGDVQRARDALVDLCAALDDETPTPDCHVVRVGELITPTEFRQLPLDDRRALLARAASDPRTEAHYNTTEAQCPYCAHRWVAVHPTSTPVARLECPSCGTQPEDAHD